MEPKLIEGGLAVDERGVVRFVNDFNFEGVKRFYIIENHQVGYVRAWHGHWEESKWITVMRGSAVIGIAKMSGEEPPKVYWENAGRYIMSGLAPQILYVPPGYANGSMALEEGTQIIHFSDKTLEEAREDDIRLWAHPNNYPWKVEPA